MKYKCVKAFTIDKYDEYGFVIENECVDVSAGSIWIVDRTSSIIGGDIHLDCFSKLQFSWIEIPKERLEHYFEQVE